MKRAIMILASLAVLGALVWTFAQVPAPPRPLAQLFPPGASLYLEARNFGALWQEWNGSPEKAQWLQSDNYQVFSRSNLFLKLSNAQTEFAAAAGVPPDMALLSNVAGAESALAMYDIGNLEFLYITRLPSARFVGSALWKARGNYQSRNSAGIDYYVRVDPKSKRVAAFAVAQEHVLLATREDALAGALALLAVPSGASLAGEPFFSKSVQAARQPGELRLVLNMQRLMDSPYVRSYWIQRNASELKQFHAAVSDLRRANGEMDETRLLFRAGDEPVTWNEAALAQLTRLVPTDANFYRAWASPTAAEALALVQPPTSTIETSRAPEAASLDTTVGSEADLEIRIDEPPLQAATNRDHEAWRKLIDAAKLDAMLQIETTRVLPDGTFIGIDSAIVLLAAAPWDANGAKSVAATVNGRVLAIANRPEFLQRILSQTSNSISGRYSARFRHAAELPHFLKMTTLIDHPLKTDGPSFFFNNIGSLGMALGRLDSASITVRDSGSVVSEDVVYRWKQ